MAYRPLFRSAALSVFPWHERTVGEHRVRYLTEEQPCVPLISTMHCHPLPIPLIVDLYNEHNSQRDNGYAYAN